MTGSLGFLGAFVAGILSFLSPCVLPLVPAYLSFMTGLTIAELKSATHDTGVTPSSAETPKIPLADVLVPSVLFVIGFSVIFVALGATASVLGEFLRQYRDVIEKAAGLLVVAFGVFMLGIIKVPWLYGEARFDMSRTRNLGRGTALLMGMAFAAGWTPCVGPILGSILALAGASGSAARGALLLTAYSLGLGVPFVAVALLFGRVSGVLRWLNRHSVVINRIAGVLLIGVGLLIFTGKLGLIAAWLSSALPGLRF